MDHSMDSTTISTSSNSANFSKNSFELLGVKYKCQSVLVNQLTAKSMALSSESSTSEGEEEVEVVVSNESDCYVYRTCTNCNSTIVAASASNNFIKLYDNQTLQLIARLEGHTDTINEIRFAKSHADVLFSCSSDGTIRIFDVRSKTQGVCYKGAKEFWSFDISASETELASGNKGDVCIWDLRTTTLLRKYEDFHCDDITQVRYHPVYTKHLFTGSEDGNICVLDTDQQDEDETLTMGINLDDTVGHISFHGPNAEQIFVLSTSERLSVWNLQGGRIAYFDDPRGKVSTEQFPLNYAVNAFYDVQTAGSFVVMGSFEGYLGIVQVDGDQLKVVSRTTGVHSGVIRWFDLDRQRAITCGEDARICIWDSKDLPNERIGSRKIHARKAELHNARERPY